MAYLSGVVDLGLAVGVLGFNPNAGRVDGDAIVIPNQALNPYALVQAQLVGHTSIHKDTATTVGQIDPSK